jgi:hypothetical protein
MSRLDSTQIALICAVKDLYETRPSATARDGISARDRCRLVGLTL